MRKQNRERAGTFLLLVCFFDPDLSFELETGRDTDNTDEIKEEPIRAADASVENVIPTAQDNEGSEKSSVYDDKFETVEQCVHEETVKEPELLHEVEPDVHSESTVSAIQQDGDCICKKPAEAPVQIQTPIIELSTTFQQKFLQKRQSQYDLVNETLPVTYTSFEQDNLLDNIVETKSKTVSSYKPPQKLTFELTNKIKKVPSAFNEKALHEHASNKLNTWASRREAISNRNQQKLTNKISLAAHSVSQDTMTHSLNTRMSVTSFPALTASRKVVPSHRSMSIFEHVLLRSPSLPLGNIISSVFIADPLAEYIVHYGKVTSNNSTRFSGLYGYLNNAFSSSPFLNVFAIEV
jgi:hypothetical protein